MWSLLRRLGAGLFLLMLAAHSYAQSSGINGGSGGGGGISFSGAVVNGNCVKALSTSTVADAGAPCGGSGAPGGTSGQLQYNNAGSFGGISGFTAGRVLQGGSPPAATATPSLGTAGTTLGTLTLFNLTSGSVALQPVTGALGSSVASLPAGTYTLAGLGITQTWGALQTFGTNISIGNIDLHQPTAIDLLNATFPASISAITGLPNLASAHGSTIPSSAGTLVGSTGSFTNGHCVQVGSTAPLEISDAGAACGAGSGATFQVNSVNLSSMTTIDFLNSAATNGLTFSFSNPSGGNVQLGLSGTLTPAGGGTGATSLAGANIPVQTGAITSGHCAQWASSTSLTDSGSTCGSGGSSAFSAITTSTNTTATMTVGSGASIAVTGSGAVAATTLATVSGLPSIADQSVIGNGSGGATNPAVLTLSGNLIATASGLSTTQKLNAQTGTTYTVSSGDAGKLVTFNNAASIAVTLPQAGTTGFTTGFSFDSQALGAGTVTITPTSSTINGASTLTIAQNRGCTITSDGTNYQVSACTAIAAGGSSAFSSITTGINTSAAMTVGSGGSIAVTGSGTNQATSLVALTGLPSQAADTLLANATGSSAPSTAVGLSGNLAFVSGALATSQGLNPQSGTTYTVVSGDAGKLVTFGNAASTAVTLPQAGTTGFASGFSIDVQVIAAGTVTITPTTSTINGASSLVLLQNEGCTISSDGTNYKVSACAAVTPAINLAGTGHRGVTGTLPAANLPAALSSSTSVNGTTIAASAGTAPGSTGSFTTSHCLQVGSTSPLEIQDSGAGCGGGGGSPGGSSGQIQYNNAGAFGGFAATAGQVVVGGTTPSGTATPTLGASGTLGSVTMGNATSGTVTVQPVAGALGAVTASLPANTGTLAETNLAQTWSATQTFGTNISIGNVNLQTPTAIVLTNGTALPVGGIAAIVANSIVANATGSSAAPTAAVVGALNIARLQAVTTFTVSGTGCTPSAHAGSALAGTITLASGPCTAVTVTMNGATGFTTTTGYHCDVTDRTTQNAGTWIPAWGESATSTTTATLPIPAAAGATDVISFACTPY